MAGGSLGQDTAVALEATELSSFLPEALGVTALREAVVDLSGARLSMDAELSMDAAVVPAGGTLVVARVERLAGVPRLVVVSPGRAGGHPGRQPSVPRAAGDPRGRAATSSSASTLALGFVAGTASVLDGAGAG